MSFWGKKRLAELRFARAVSISLLEGCENGPGSGWLVWPWAAEPVCLAVFAWFWGLSTAGVEWKSRFSAGMTERRAETKAKDLMGILPSHPSDKDKDVARVGHPDWWLGGS